MWVSTKARFSLSLISKRLSLARERYFQAIDPALLLFLKLYKLTSKFSYSSLLAKMSSRAGSEPKLELKVRA